MFFLADENLPLPSIKHLRKTGTEIVSVAQECPGVSDETVLNLARDNGQIIVTLDRDFGELIFRRRLPAPPGLLYLHLVPRSPVEPAEYVLRLLAIDDLKLKGLFTTVSRSQIRQRPLPEHHVL